MSEMKGSKRMYAETCKRLAERPWLRPSQRKEMAENCKEAVRLWPVVLQISGCYRYDRKLERRDRGLAGNQSAVVGFGGTAK